MGLKLSSNNGGRMRTYSASSPGSGTESSARARTRSLVNFGTNGGDVDFTGSNGADMHFSGSNGRHSGSLTIPSSGDIRRNSSPDSDSSSPGEGSTVVFAGRTFTHSVPVHLFSLQGLKCPVCSKQIASDDIEYHLVLCLTKPRISYNEDVLSEDKGECAICFEELIQGDTIARLPCLCIYHKGCIDKWFQVNRSCPEHPSD